MSWEIVHEVGERRARLDATPAFAPVALGELPDGTRLTHAPSRRGYLVRSGGESTLRRILRILLARPRGGRSLWHLLRDLEGAGQPCARPVWLAERGSRWLLLARTPLGARSLPRFIDEEFRGGLPGPRERLRLLRAIARRLRAASARGWRLDELRPEELMASGWGGDFDFALAGPAETSRGAGGTIPARPLLRLAAAAGDRLSTPELLRLLAACDARHAARQLVRARRRSG